MEPLASAAAEHPVGTANRRESPISTGALADRILKRFGSSTNEAEISLHGESNEVWIAPKIVLRLARSPGSDNLLREARLAELLPPEVGYPSVLDSGLEDDHEWMITVRIPGEQLAATWKELTRDDQRSAVESLWERLRAAQATNVEAAIAIGCTTTPFYALDQSVAVSQLSTLQRDGLLAGLDAEALLSLLASGFEAMESYPRALAHTDAGPHNAIWDSVNHQVIPIDFEFACVAPADLDLERLLRYIPQLGPHPERLLLQLAAELLARPGVRDRLVGYAVQRDLWALRLWAQHAARREDRPNVWPPTDIEAWDPWQRLRDCVDGESLLMQL